MRPAKRYCAYCGTKANHERTTLWVNDGQWIRIWKCECCGLESPRRKRALKATPELDRLFDQLAALEHDVEEAR